MTIVLDPLVQTTFDSLRLLINQKAKLGEAFAFPQEDNNIRSHIINNQTHREQNLHVVNTQFRPGEIRNNKNNFCYLYSCF